MSWTLLAGGLIVVVGVLVGALLLTGTRAGRRRSTGELGKGEGNAGSARYQNRSSRGRDR